MLKIHEPLMTLFARVLVVGGLSGGASVLAFLNSSLLAAIFFGVLSVMLTYVIIFSWFHTGIFEEGENLRFSNKSHGINTVYTKREVEKVTLQRGELEIILRGKTGTFHFPAWDVGEEQLQELNRRLRAHHESNQTSEVQRGKS